MDKEYELRKEFAEELAKAVEEIARRYGLEEIAQSRHEPLVLAARGCLSREGKKGEQIELAVLLSRDIRRAEELTILAQAINEQIPEAAPAQIYRSYDISESIAEDAASAGDEIEQPDECDNDQPIVK
jgi:hypothetical protein